jgi:prophage antirepressor-like protein
MNSLTTFEFESQSVRVLILNGESWFVAKDIADALAYADPSKMTNLVDEDDKQTINPQKLDSAVLAETFGNNTYKLSVINESGMYACIFGSTKAQAKRFKKWVTSEVLPTIRKTGTYSVTDIPTPATQAELLAAIAQQMVEQERRIAEQERQMAEIVKELNSYGYQTVGKDGKMQPMVHGIAGLSLAVGSNIHDLNRLDYQVYKLEEAVNKLKASKPSLPALTSAMPLKSASESRQTIREMVNSFACKTGTQQMELWRRLYKELYRRCGVCLTQGKEDSQTRLDAVSELGTLDTLRAIASEVLV